MVRVKICGITSVEDALATVEAGADAIGLNFASSSPRRVTTALASAIVRALPAHVVTVGVFVDADKGELRRTIDAVGLRCIQLHGDETPELLFDFLPHAYKAIRVRGPGSLLDAARYPGDHILLDAYVAGVAGGTGARFDWTLAAELARSRHLTLAGGLTPENVAEAVRAVRPFCVDVASGIEVSPGKKDHEKLRSFITHAKAAG
jgi:phosphoribosylanthranilate isomerase